MVKRIIINILFIGLTSIVCNAQNRKTIEAKIQNYKGQNVIGSVQMLLPNDSSVIKSIPIKKGRLFITGLNTETVILRIVADAFNDTIIGIKFISTENTDLGTITLKEKINTETNITVKSKVNPIIQKADGTTEIRVASSLLSSSSTINEILSQSPGVQVDGNTVSVFGKGQAILYLNNKRITEEQFAAIPVAQIEKIEIITNPSAKYDAEGRAVINIKTKKTIEDGYRGSVKHNTSYSKFASGFNTLTSANIDTKENKFSLQGNYAIQLGKDKEVLHTIRTRYNASEFLNSNLITSWNRNWDNFSNYELGTQYDISKLKYISVKYSGFNNKLGGNQISDNTISSIYGDGKYNSIIKTNNTTKNNTFSVNYNAVLDSLGSSIFIGAQYTNFKNGANDFVDEKRFETSNMQSFLNNQINNKINIASGQLDYNKVFGNDKTLEAGARISFIENGSVLNFFSSPNGISYIKLDTLSNKFKYQELIPAGYINFKRKVSNNLSYNIGLRTELTKYLLSVNAFTNINTNKTYFNIFPNASITYKVNTDLSLNTSISSRISRVNYRSLNPNLVYQDPFTSVQGNPFLLPEKSYAIELNTKYKTLNLKLGYDYTIDPLDGAALRGSTPRSYILFRINMQKRQNYFATISKSLNNNWLTSNSNFTLTYSKMFDNVFGFERSLPKPQIYFYSNNIFKVSKRSNIELLMVYTGRLRDGLNDDKSRYNITISADRGFYNNKLKARIIANDIFHGIIASGDYNVAKTQIYFNRRWTTQYFRLALVYSFGELKKLNYNNKLIGESESNRTR